tara:strand:- start:1134 stop:1529 length:396 start_codon:yes stop_codon:yes gene_type:complete
MKEANKENKLERSQMNRVRPEQREEQLQDYLKIATDKDGKVDNTLYNSLVKSYDDNHLVVGVRIDNWLVIKESSPEASKLVDTINNNFASLNALIEKSNILLAKKGSEVLGIPRATHKVEIIIPKTETSKA